MLVQGLGYKQTGTWNTPKRSDEFHVRSGQQYLFINELGKQELVRVASKSETSGSNGLTYSIVLVPVDPSEDRFKLSSNDVNRITDRFKLPGSEKTPKFGPIN
ncbi:MAG: hypothetical protein VKJ06_03005 [Vampirovibrionales bacterium]|nr:hypothetical protein [Vampirovibrionales bacterium]